MTPGNASRESRSKRISLFALTSITPGGSNVRSKDTVTPGQGSRSFRKRFTAPSTSVENADLHPTGANSPPQPEYTPSMSRRSSLGIRPSLSGAKSAVFSSSKSTRSTHDDDGRVSVASSRTASLTDADRDGIDGPQTILLHGEVQTSGNMFRKKKEYLLLSNTNLYRFKSGPKAAEVFNISPVLSRGSNFRHSSAQSLGSAQDMQSIASDASGGEHDARVALRDVVAVYRLHDGKPYFALDICYLDDHYRHSSILSLQFAQPEERDRWLSALRSAITNASSQHPAQITPYCATSAARAVERENDYNPDHFAMYTVVQRSLPKPARASTDDLSKITSNVCMLVIGIYKVHMIPLPKPMHRSSPVLNHTGHSNHGILTMSAIKVDQNDDTFQLTFRQPLKRPHTLHLASSQAHAIALRLLQVENSIRPEYPYRLFRMSLPPQVEERIMVGPSEDEDHAGLVSTLTAYCVAYNINLAAIRYTINYDCEHSPRFELLPPDGARGRDYHVLELLAVMRALRYNESFGSISFADIRLDGLHGVHDTYGTEYVCTRTKRGTPLPCNDKDLDGSSLLIQELRALAATSKRLRRIDFTNCISARDLPAEDNDTTMLDFGCGIVEALFPLCKTQTTNVDCITLNGIALSDTDLDYLVGASVDRSCHFRALDIERCGLNDRTLGLVLDALRAQDNTLEALNISGNLTRLSPVAFDNQISVFGFIRRLDLSKLVRTSGEESLLAVDTLLSWRLEVLRLSGTSVNRKTVEALAIYVQSAQSETLKDLAMDNTGITAGDIATLMTAMTSNVPRDLHLNVSKNSMKAHSELVDAISANKSPTQVTLRAVEYRDEVIWRQILLAFSSNTSTAYLDISRASLPGDANEETSKALGRLFADNTSLQELDISGEDSRLETSKFGAGLNTALDGLQNNKYLTVLRIQYQKLGVQGAGALANVIKLNTTLREVHCEHNDFPLSALTDLVNALYENTTLIYLPLMDEHRNQALKHTERQVKQMRDDRPVSPKQIKGSLSVRRGIANVRQTVAARAATLPAFPNLASTPNDERRTATSSFSEQDIQAALRLVAESWDRQQYRLQQYLERNWCILHDIPTKMDIEEEDYERPAGVRTNDAGNRDSMASLQEVLDRAHIDSTPRVEKQMDFQTDLMSALEMTRTSEPVQDHGILGHGIAPSPTSLHSRDEPSGQTIENDDGTGLGIGGYNQ